MRPSPSRERAKFPAVVCPGCLVTMKPQQTEAGHHNLVKTRYQCERCATETERIYRKADAGRAS
jgi:hypothetical protein